MPPHPSFSFYYQPGSMPSHPGSSQRGVTYRVPICRVEGNKRRAKANLDSRGRSGEQAHHSVGSWDWGLLSQEVLGADGSPAGSSQGNQAAARSLTPSQDVWHLGIAETRHTLLTAPRAAVTVFKITLICFLFIGLKGREAERQTDICYLLI